MDTQYTMNYQHNIPAHLLGPDDKIELAVLSFSLDGISAIGRSLIDHAIEHPWLYGIAAGLIVGGTLFLPLPVITGFGRYGPIAGKSFFAFRFPLPFPANGGVHRETGGEVAGVDRGRGEGFAVCDPAEVGDDWGVWGAHFRGVLWGWDGRRGGDRGEDGSNVGHVFRCLSGEELTSGITM